MLVPAETAATIRPTIRPVFVDAVKTALKQWQLPGIKKALVVVTFRDWVMFPILPSVPIQWGQLKHTLPLPTSVTWPAYPEPNPNKHFAMPAAVILHLQIDEGGHVSALRVLRGAKEASKAAIEAVKQWKFSPAQDESGKPTGSGAYAVCVYRPLSRTGQ
jgi:TonB family protein